MTMTTARELTAPAFGPGFGQLLREYRDQRRFSQSRLAEAALFDHSMVSRWESGARMPTRKAVLRLADAMVLADVDRDALLVAAGFVPLDLTSLIDDPTIGALAELLTDPSVPGIVKTTTRELVAAAVSQARSVTQASWPVAAGDR